MLGLTPLGVVHTLVALLAVVCALVSFARHHKIDPRARTGKIYIVATLVTCLTGFGIFQHGGFGDAHVLGIATIVVLGIAIAAGQTRLFGKLSKYIETVSYTTTFFFHLIPAIVETTTRLPADAPLFATAQAPELKAATGLILVSLMIVAGWQVRSITRS